jgi:3-oxoadipate enol-lactonase
MARVVEDFIFIDSLLVFLLPRENATPPLTVPLMPAPGIMVRRRERGVGARAICDRIHARLTIGNVGSYMSATSQGCRASNGIYYRMEGDGEPLLLLHGLMVSGAMFDPLVALLRDRFRMVIPDLRGHGRSGDLAGPYDVPALAADLPAVLAEAGFERCAVLGYSHGGAVAQQLTHDRPAVVGRLILGCTYACNASTLKERVEGEVLAALLRVFSPGTLAKLILRPSKPRPGGAIGLTRDQVDWLRPIMGANRAPAMRGAVRGLVSFDSRAWLSEIAAPTLVIGATHDHAVPQHHFDTLVRGIPGATGRLVDRAGHTLVWTHTRELADLIRA